MSHETTLDIRAPLLAFSRVCRRTGPIRRTCLFHNRSENEREIEVRFGFKEHSWIRFLDSDDTGATTDAGESARLRLTPGQNRVQVVLNTDSSNFPYDQFRGRVYFEDEEDTADPRWVEISFEEIEELQDFQGYAAIDLGTCNSMISLYHLRRDALRGTPWSPALERDRLEVPSAIFIKDLARFRKLADGACSIGQAALADYRERETHDPRSLQLSVKRLIGSPSVLAADAQGAGGAIAPENILYMLGRAIRERAQGHDEVKARLRKLTVTFPPTWDYPQLACWRQIFERLGFSQDDLDLSLDEASAAGLFHVYRWIKDPDARGRLLQDLTHSWKQVKEGQETGDSYVLRLLSFDFGGGTIDLACIKVEITLFEEVIRLRLSLEGSDSLMYGGDQVTLAVFRILKRRLAMALSHPERFREDETPSGPTAEELDRASVESGLFLLPGENVFFGPGRVRDADEAAREILRERWDDLDERIADEELSPALEDAVDTLVPTRFWTSPEEPLSLEAKRNFGWLWDQAEFLKRELFQEANRRSGDISLSADRAEEIQGGILLSELPEELAERLPSGGGLSDARISLSIGEIYRAIRGPIEQAVLRGRALVSDEKADRVVLSGQSSWIPLVRRLFMRPRSDGGLGLPPNKIEFDSDNAKAAVCKGACLLPVMRDTLVGFDVDISNFKANLLGDISYHSSLSGDRPLFSAGPIDDLRYREDAPDPSSFANHLSIFIGSDRRLLGQFDFSKPGDEVPPFESHARQTLEKLDLGDSFPSYETVMKLEASDPRKFGQVVSHLRDWPERALVAWIERDAAIGSPEQPIYRYYATRNRNLLAVRDRGEQDKRLFAIELEARRESGVSPRENPFSGVH